MVPELPFVLQRSCSDSGGTLAVVKHVSGYTCAWRAVSNDSRSTANGRSRPTIVTS